MIVRRCLCASLSLAILAACAPKGEPAAGDAAQADAGQVASSDSASPASIAKLALGSKDHTTLVAALKAVNWLDALASPGPFTVFAPVNAAFDQLPKGTVENLLKPENAGQLRTILLHHVLVSAYGPERLTDGATLSPQDGGPLTVKRVGDKLMIDDATIVAQVKAGNGMLYIVDKVILPKGDR